MFKLTIDTGNAAFEDDSYGPELARILRKLADQLEAKGECSANVFDINGNRVGTKEIICDA